MPDGVEHAPLGTDGRWRSSLACGAGNDPSPPPRLTCTAPNAVRCKCRQPSLPVARREGESLSISKKWIALFRIRQLFFLTTCDSFCYQKDLIGGKVCRVLRQTLFHHQATGDLGMIHADNIFGLPAFGISRVDFVGA